MIEYFYKCKNEGREYRIMKIQVNAIGDACPIPVIKTKKAMQELKGNQVLEVLVDNETAVKNVTKFANSMGAEAVSEKLEEKKYRIEIKGSEIGDTDTEETCKAEIKGDTIVVVASDKMGEGNDELGKVLMKGFIFPVTQLDELPKTMLFYNGGATLTAEGSDSLEDLKGLEEQGVEILTCGTCLNYYGLTEKLKVGTVTNMYNIVEKMAQAGRIIRP